MKHFNLSEIEEMSSSAPAVAADQIRHFRDFVSNYNRLTEQCFIDCIWDFTTRDIKSQEEKCTLNCLEKFLKMRQRINSRFSEHQMTENENALSEARKSGAVY